MEVNRLATKGEKYYLLPTKRVKNYRLQEWIYIIQTYLYFLFVFQKEEHIVCFLPLQEVTKDNNDFINFIEKTKHAFLVSMDVTSLFTNILPNESIDRSVQSV